MHYMVNTLQRQIYTDRQTDSKYIVNKMMPNNGTKTDDKRTKAMEAIVRG